MNNTRFTCPPLMSDQRLFTDYRQNSDLTNRIKVQNGIYTNVGLKDFLIHNGAELRHKYNVFYDNRASCKSDNGPTPNICKHI